MTTIKKIFTLKNITATIATASFITLLVSLTITALENMMNNPVHTYNMISIASIAVLVIASALFTLDHFEL